MGSTRSGGTPTDTRRSAARASAGDTVTALPETALVLSRLLRRLRAVLLPSAGRAVRHPENQVFEEVLPRFGDDGRIGDCTRAHGVLDRQALESRYRGTIRSRRELGLLVSGVDAAHPLMQRERAPGFRRALNLWLQLVDECSEPVSHGILHVGLERCVPHRDMPISLRQPSQGLLRLEPEGPDLRVRPTGVGDLALQHRLNGAGEGRLERFVGSGRRESGHGASH